MTTDNTTENVTFDIIAELKNALTIIDYAAEQGAFKGWQVINQVLAVRGRVAAFVDLFEEAARQKAAEDAVGNSVVDTGETPVAAPVDATDTPTTHQVVVQAEAPPAPVTEVMAPAEPVHIETDSGVLKFAAPDAPVAEPTANTSVGDDVAVVPAIPLDPAIVEEEAIIQAEKDAPERKIFYIDVGSLSTEDAASYIEQVKTEIQQRGIPTQGSDPVETPPANGPAPQFNQELLDTLKSKDAADLLSHEIAMLQSLQATFAEANKPQPN